jgi:NADH-quinone oxidoreductase subunit G
MRSEARCVVGILFGPAADNKIEYFHQIPEAVSRIPGECLVVPMHHIFGSEYYSMLAPAIAEVAVQPYIAMTTEDMELLSVVEDDLVEMICKEGTIQLPAKRIASLPPGLAGIPYGLAGLKWVDLPARCRITKAKNKNE